MSVMLEIKHQNGIQYLNPLKITNITYAPLERYGKKYRKRLWVYKLIMKKCPWYIKMFYSNPADSPWDTTYIRPARVNFWDGNEQIFTLTCNSNTDAQEALIEYQKQHEEKLKLFTNLKDAI